MIKINQNIVIVGNLHLEKWLCAKIHIAKGNGFIWNASKKRNCHRNGTVKNAEWRRK